MFPDWTWYSISINDPRAVSLYSRHYSSSKNRGSVRLWLRHGIGSPGEKLVLTTSDSSALFVWIRQKYVSNNQEGVNCSVFRNESYRLSSDLILEAEGLAWKKWPGERLYTYVDPNSIVSRNPGYCFKMAGWTLARDETGKPIKTARGLVILEKLPNLP